MKYYGIGSRRKKDSEGNVTEISVVIPLTEKIRVLAVQEAERKARKDKVRLTGVYLEASQRNDRGGILTKNMLKQRAESKR